jgi:hypothetical protein
MTEAEWLKCVDPAQMLWFLQGRLAERQFRLFNCACCRRIWRLLTDERSRYAVEVTERHADGAADDGELDAAYDAAAAVPGDPVLADPRVAAAFAAQAAAVPLIGTYYGANVTDSAANAVHYEAFQQALTSGARHLPPGVLRSEQAAQAGLLRDIIGNPFRPSPGIDAAWLAWNAGVVKRVALRIYEERRFQDLPILTDVLEEAGCDDADILAHCRGGGDHVRGCWVVDLLRPLTPAARGR